MPLARVADNTTYMGIC